MIPDDLTYTREHEWIASTGDDTVRIGITDYAQDQLGDVVFVQLPAVGETSRRGDSLGEVESTKSVADVYAPLSGEVIARNDALEETPELVNSDPYGEGWMIELRLTEPAELDDLLDADAYRALLDEH